MKINRYTQNLAIHQSWFIGWTRGHDRFGRIEKYHLKTFCNTLTQFCGRCFLKDAQTQMANTTPYVLIEYASEESVPN